MRTRESTVPARPFPCIGLAALLLLAACTSAERHVFVPVDGHALHLYAMGSADPTVVLEGGTGSSHAEWSELQPRLAEFARVVSYDRAGFGESPPCFRTRDARTIATELHDALHGAAMPPPYVLVGWSMGGLLVREFAALYPDEVTGLVLLDPSIEDFYPRAESAFPEAAADADAEYLAGLATAEPGEVAEDAAWKLMLEQARASTALLRAPVILLTGPRLDLAPMDAMWRDEQARWIARVGGTLRLLPDTGHAVHEDRPDAVIEAVREMCARASATLPMPADPGR